jgi:Phosphotransferase enzyme family
MPGIPEGGSGPAGAAGLALDGGDGTVIGLDGLPPGVGSVIESAEILRHNVRNAATGGIWRVQGDAGSAVLKVARPPSGRPDGSSGWPTSDEPSHWNYWRREARAYQAGLTREAYGEAGIAAADLLASGDRADGGVELWLADVSGTGGFSWPPGRLGRFAYELGAGQARWAGRVPATGWLSRGWLAGYLAEGPSTRVAIGATDWDHPSVAAWPGPVRHQLRALWVGQRRVLATAQASERTLCHLDVWPANLIDDAGRSVLLDWAFAGEGALGEDVANLILDCFADGLMDAALLPEISESVTDGYLAGLREGGWAGKADAVRAAIAACGAAKYSWFAPAVIRSAVRDDAGPSSYRAATSAAALVERLAPVVTLIARWAAAVLS